MHAVLLTVHGLIVLSLIVIVLLQRSEGGALGMGGGGGGGFMTSRGAANVLTRTTSILAALFFMTSIALALTARSGESEADIVEDLTGERVIDPTRPLTTEDLLDTLGTGATTPQPSAPPALGAAPVEPAPTGDSVAAPDAAAAGPAAAPAAEPDAPAQPN
ncbi:MAG: preprotein translocase subunit SecG [Parvularculaceae bacterium]|nr:preprotein translocase subunit SecG [Parvularculaceae bacterium]